MKLKLFPPTLIFYTERFMKDWQGAAARGPFVTIREKYRDNRGLLEHELFHSLQWWMTLGLHSLLYLFVPKYRYWSEIWAYRRQLKYSPGRERLYAGFVATHYNLKVTEEQVLKDLMK
jgi:hypothetical protein